MTPVVECSCGVPAAITQYFKASTEVFGCIGVLVGRHRDTSVGKEEHAEEVGQVYPETLMKFSHEVSVAVMKVIRHQRVVPPSEIFDTSFCEGAREIQE